MTLTRRSLVATATSGIVASALTMPAIASAQTTSPIAATPAAGTPDLESSVLSAMDVHGIPGAIVLLDSQETGRWSAALGVADLDSGAPMTTDMHMRIGSITKTFTATMILQLVDQGALALENTLATLLPDHADLPNADAVTLRHLLTMQSGIPDYMQSDEAVQESADPNLSHVYTPDELLSFIAGQPALFVPGSRSVYSNTNYLLLNMIANEVTGTPWEELVRTGILDQAGLANTSIPDTPELPSPASRGYAYGSIHDAIAEAAATPMTELATPIQGTPEPAAAPTDFTLLNPSLPGPAGSMISTIDDLATWMEALRDGSLLSPELQADRLELSDEGVMESPIQTMRYGLGITESNGRIGHDGGIEGFRSSMAWEPESDTTVITLANVLPTRDGSDPAAVLVDALINA